MLNVRTELDGVLIRPQRVRVFLCAFYAEKVRLAADCDDQIIERILILRADDSLLSQITTGDFVGYDLDFSPAKDFS